MHFQKAVAIALLVEGAAGRDIVGQPSDGVYVIHESSSSFSMDRYPRGSISINSNVPVTIQQYNDRFTSGKQAVLSNKAYLLVTSDCDATASAPQVSWGEYSVNVTVEEALDPDYTPFFLPSSSHDASWSYELNDYWCKRAKSAACPKGGGVLSLKSALRRMLKWKSTKRERTEEEQEEAEEPEEMEEEPTVRSSRSSNDCMVNVEVMFDGCEHGATITAPKVRVLEGGPTNLRSSPDATNDCVTNYEADLAFPGPPSMESNGTLEVPSLGKGGSCAVCSRPCEGRPFVDAVGSALQASAVAVPTVVGGSRAWSGGGGVQLSEPRPAFDNSTVHPNQRALGEAWTTSALGEHASVASFAAFAIALMTNGAPADLVQDALAAALDEVRHAQTSFEIASWLLGREVGPGPLPESRHEFGRDLMALALAVAREGCVDETLSALEAAAKVDAIDAALANGIKEGSKYSGIDEEILTWIRDELHIIAMEESSHAALAWRTLRWVCEADSDACDVVEQSVLNEDKLEGALRRRFGSADGIVADNWRKIYSYDDVDARVCTSGGVDGDTEDAIETASLVSVVATHVLHGISCS